jgi:glutathione S-transferase
MILIGQYDSPFVRRVGIAMRLYGMPFEHRPWSVFADADRLQDVNPLIRVPTLILDDGFVLADSHMILDYLDSLVETPLFPRTEPARHRALKIAALATGLADKAVSLFYERRLHDTMSPVWETRCQAQITSVLDALEADRATRAGPWWLSDQMGHADIAVACALRFTTDVHPGLVSSDHPALLALSHNCEATDVFREISQAFVPPT